MGPVVRALALASAGIRSLTNLGMIVSLICLVGMLVFISASVVGRYTGMFALRGSTEVGAYLMAGMFFLGLAYSFRSNAFIVVAPFRKRIPERFVPALETIHLSLALGFAAVLTIFSWSVVLENKDFATSTFGIYDWPLWVIQLPMPIGCTLLLAQLGSLLFERIALGRPAPSGEVVSE